MNKVKSSCGKKYANTESQSIKNEINLEEKIEKLSIKSKNVNGLVNGLDHKTINKSNKKDKRSSKQPDMVIESTNNINEASIKDDINDLNVKMKIVDNIPSTSDIQEKKYDSDEKISVSELKGVKTKSKAKRTEPEKSMPNTSTKSDYRIRFDDGDSGDFDIMGYIKTKYGDKKDDDREIEKEKDPIVEKLVTTEIDESEPRVAEPEICYLQYESEIQMPMIMKIIQKDLSEPYSIYTYRYFIHNWPNLCFLAMCSGECVGAIVCKLDIHRKLIKRGYIAMLAVDKRYRKHGIGSTLVKRAIEEMIAGNADEVVLETEITNKPALRLYEALGFVRDKRLFRYYLNGVDALRLKLWLR